MLCFQKKSEHTWHTWHAREWENPDQQWALVAPFFQTNPTLFRFFTTDSQRLFQVAMRSLQIGDGLSRRRRHRWSEQKSLTKIYEASLKTWKTCWKDFCALLSAKRWSPGHPDSRSYSAANPAEHGYSRPQLESEVDHCLLKWFTQNRAEKAYTLPLPESSGPFSAIWIVGPYTHVPKHPKQTSLWWIGFCSLHQANFWHSFDPRLDLRNLWLGVRQVASVQERYPDFISYMILSYSI